MEVSNSTKFSQRCSFLVSCCAVAHKEFKVLRKSRSVCETNSQIESQKPKPNKLICSVNRFWVFWYLHFSQQPPPHHHHIEVSSIGFAVALNPNLLLMRATSVAWSRRMLRASNCIHRCLSFLAWQHSIYWRGTAAFTAVRRINDVRSMAAHFIREFLSYRLRCFSIFFEFIWFLRWPYRCVVIDTGCDWMWLTVTPSMRSVYWFCCRKQKMRNVWKWLKI